MLNLYFCLIIYIINDVHYGTINFFFFLEISCALTESDILKDWEWLENNLNLKIFENEEDVTEFVCCKIKSLVATNKSDTIEEENSESFKDASIKFYRLFNVSRDCTLVCYYSCR